MATSAAIRQHLVDALGQDLIGPDWSDTARRHEHLPQPPSVWCTTGFLVPHVFEQEAGRTTEDEQLSFADLAGEEPSNGASNRLEKQEKDDDANDALDQASTRRSWFPSSLGLSFILEKGSSLEATVTWGITALLPMEPRTRSGAARSSGKPSRSRSIALIPARTSPLKASRKACVCVGSPGQLSASSATPPTSSPSRCSCSTNASHPRPIRSAIAIRSRHSRLRFRCAARGVFRHVAMPCSRPPRIPMSAWRPCSTGVTIASRVDTTSP